MSSKKINLKGIGARLIGWSTLLLILSLVFVSATVYYLLSSTLRQNGRVYLERLTLSYAQSLSVNPAGFTFKNEINPEVMVKVLDKDGKTELFSKLPDFIEKDADDEKEIQQINQEYNKLKLQKGFETILLLSGEEDDDVFLRMEYWLRKFTHRQGWTNITPMLDNDLFEVYTMPLENGGWIRVGTSSEEVEEHLSSIRYISIVVIIPFIFIGFIANFILSRTILGPLKNLATTIEDLKKGNLAARGKVSGNGDEVDLLASEFNQLLDQNEILISNLKSTIDNVAHDLRTPLTRFRSSVENALTHPENPALYKEALQDGLENAEQIRELLDAIMDVSEAETQTMNVKKEELSLTDLVHGIVDLYQYTAEEKDIQLEAFIESDIQLMGDHVRLAQALGNIMDNAIKYSPNQTKVKITVGESQGFAQIDISDQGIGIAESEREKIWERLYRIDQSRSTPGLGIGLSVVKAVIMAHQGTIEVLGAQDKGSTFRIRLPIGNV